MCISWPHICFTIHLLWCIAYTVIGTIQVIIGVFFLALPILKLGSNIWVGIWNITFGIGGAVYALMGKWTLGKQRIFLYLATSVLIANVVNLVLLEIGEWHILVPENIKKLIEQGNLKTLVLYARTITSLSTIAAAVISFFDSQITFCSMQYHERYHRTKVKEKQDVLSDTEYVLPRVKCDSDENENASYYNKQYPQSWVYETQTAETTSTINSVPNRYSGTSNDKLLDSKQTPSEAEFKDISTQNLTIEQPVVVVENTSDYTDRQLHYMASFSRTPSPVPGSDSSSENSCSIKGYSSQKGVDDLTEPAAYRSRLNSAKSANAVVIDRSQANVSPRPPSISGIDQLQQESLFSGLQKAVSNKSFKISADQIFIPLKDETVIRINDEIFITKPASKVENDQSHEIQCSPKNLEPPLPPKTEPKKGIVPPGAGNGRPFLPEVVQVICKERIYAEPTTNTTQTKASSPIDKPFSIPPSLEQTMPSPKDLLPVKIQYPLPLLEQQDAGILQTEKVFIPEGQDGFSTSKNVTNTKTEQSLGEVVEQYLHTSPAHDIESTKYRKEERDCTIPWPLLERQTQIDRDETITVENSETYMLSSPQFDRQDTVICAKTPSPLYERQSFIERQDAIVSPKDDKSYHIPALQNDSEVFPSLIEEIEASTSRNVEKELRQSDEIDSNNSNNASTDKDTIIDFKSSDDIDMPIQNVQDCGLSIRNTTPDIIECIAVTRTNGEASGAMGNEIDNIFRIAEDSSGLEDRDPEGEELFNMRSNSGDMSTDHIRPPEMDINVFENVLPPEEIDEINGVDPDEWEESDDDSMDSSCVQRVPPPPSNT